MHKYIYIVNWTEGPQGPGAVAPSSAYFHEETKAADFFEDQKEMASEDGLYVELVRLDVTTLEAITISGWEGTDEDYENGDYEEDEDEFLDGTYEEA